LKCNADTLVT